jgi:hypothetical protein
MIRRTDFAVTVAGAFQAQPVSPGRGLSYFQQTATLLDPFLYTRENILLRSTPTIVANPTLGVLSPDAGA